MKSFALLLLIYVTAFAGCISLNEKKDSRNNILVFTPAIIESEVLTGTVEGECDLGKQQLVLAVKLKNISEEGVIIENIGIETPEGYQARVIGNDLKPSRINVGSERILILQFVPVNDVEVYMLTGESGKFRQQYNLNIAYASSKNDKTGLLNLSLSIPEKEFAAYEKQYKKNVEIYEFDTSCNFAEKQQMHLRTLLKAPPFVHAGTQEIAIGGLNFRLQIYRRNDTIQAQLYIVNHADFAVKINPYALNIITDKHYSNDEPCKIAFTKITGRQEETEMLRRGDRATIKFVKYINHTTKKDLTISLKNVFLLQGDKPLFYENPKLAEL